MQIVMMKPQKKYKVWVDGLAPAPNDKYVWCRSVRQAQDFIESVLEKDGEIEMIDIGNTNIDGGIPFIELMKWCERIGYIFTYNLHFSEPDDVVNYKSICARNEWVVHSI